MVSRKSPSAAWVLGVLAAVLIALRLAAVFTAFDAISYGDELDLGTIALEMLRGNSQISFWDYQLEPYSGTSLILGPLVIPFFLLLGKNYFALKMTALFFSVLTLCGIFWFIRRHFGLKAAMFSSLLFVFCPPVLVQLSMTALTGKIEAFFFSFLGLIFFFEYLYKKKTLFNLIAAGLISGFSVWFHYGNAILAVSCLVLAALLEKRDLNRTMLVFGGTFLIGFSPWFIGNSLHHFSGTGLLQNGFSGLDFETVSYTLRKTARFFLKDLPNAFGTPRTFAYLYFLVLLIAVSPLLWEQLKHFWKGRKISSQAALFVIYPLVFTVVFVFSKFEVESGTGYYGYRYLTSLLILLLAAAGTSLAARPGKAFILALLLVMGAAGQVKEFFLHAPSKIAFAYKGYSYSQLGARWQLNLYPYFKDYADFRGRTEKMPANERKFLIWGIYSTAMCCGDGFTLFNIPGAADRGLTLEALLAGEGAAYSPFLYEWLGALPQSVVSERPRLKKLQEEVPKENRKYFCRGLLSTLEHSEDFLRLPEFFTNDEVCSYREVEMAGGLHIDYLRPEKFEELQRKIIFFSQEEKSWVYRGWGHLFVSHSDISDPAVLASYSISEAHLKDVYWGIGWGLRDIFREDRARALNAAAGLPTAERGHAIEGFMAFERWYELA